MTSDGTTHRAMTRTAGDILEAKARRANSILCEVPGKPVPCPRPRVTRGRTYYSDAYDEWREGAKVLLRQACIKQNGGRLLSGPVEMDVTFYGAHGSADIDNLIKSVMDAMQGTVLGNDVQVVRLRAFKEKDRDKRTVVHAWLVDCA